MTEETLRDRPDGAEKGVIEVLVTPEMISAGVAVLVQIDPGWDNDASAVEAIFRAMMLKRG